MGELRPERGSGKAGANCLTGVSGCSGGRPMSMVGVLISGKAAGVVGTEGAGVVGLGVVDGSAGVGVGVGVGVVVMDTGVACVGAVGAGVGVVGAGVAGVMVLVAGRAIGRDVGMTTAGVVETGFVDTGVVGAGVVGAGAAGAGVGVGAAVGTLGTTSAQGVGLVTSFFIQLCSWHSRALMRRLAGKNKLN